MLKSLSPLGVLSLGTCLGFCLFVISSDFFGSLKTSFIGEKGC